MSILKDIIRDKRAEVAALKADAPLEEMRRLALNTRAPKSLGRALSGDKLKLIAEIKKASPSKGLLAPNLDAVNLAKIYTRNGAAVISVITEKNYFQGDISYLASIKKALGPPCPPLLRKDFIFEPYQVYETRARGADGLLLIAAALNRAELASLLSLSHKLQLDCIVEVHNKKELQAALECGAEIIGINNRNLDTFEVNLDTTRLLIPLIPGNCTVVSESGFKNHRDVESIRSLGINAILVGEALVTQPDIARKIRELL